MLATPKNTPPSRVIDANGLEWKAITQVDTVTGEAIQYVVDEDTGLMTLNEEGNDMVKHTITLPSPVLLVPIVNNPLCVCAKGDQ